MEALVVNRQGVGAVHFEPQYPEPVDLAPLVIHEITLIGSRCGPFPPALELLRRRQLEVLPLISALYPLSRGVEAFRRAAEPGVVKVLLRPGAST